MDCVGECGSSLAALLLAPYKELVVEDPLVLLALLDDDGGVSLAFALLARSGPISVFSILDFGSGTVVFFVGGVGGGLSDSSSLSSSLLSLSSDSSSSSSSSFAGSAGFSGGLAW